MVYKNFVVHPKEVMDAHLAGCAAGMQGKFHEFMETFWEKGYQAAREEGDASKLGVENIMAMAKDIGLDVEKLKKDMQSEACRNQIRNDMEVLSRFGVNGTPTFFINGRHTGFAGPDDFRQKIEKAIAEVEASDVPAGEYYEKVVMEKGAKELQTRGK